MSPDDPRHGSRRGYYAHKRDGEEACADCKRGAAAGQARHEMLRDRGVQQRVDPTGTRRRIQALVALGWTFTALDRELGVIHMCEKWANEHRDYMYASTAVKVAALYDRLSMTLPPAVGRHERTNATRARNLARRNGWPPPLAFDNIDDPNEQPRGWTYTGVDRKSRRDILLDLDAQHAGITAACRALRVRRDAIERWCARHDLTDLYSRLVDREQQRYWANGRAEGGVA